MYGIEVKQVGMRGEFVEGAPALQVKKEVGGGRDVNGGW